MLFEDFLARINAADLQMLPGENAHLRMAPPHRRNAVMPVAGSTSVRVAAVLALIVPDANRNAAIVIIERTGGSSVHASQFSFPGGKQEQDEELYNTALRETQEEIGVSKDHIAIVSELTRLFIPPSNFLVYPFLGIMHQRPVYSISENEVQQVYEIPLGDLLHESAVKQGVFGSSSGYQVQAPFYEWSNVRIWGATAMMISEIIELIRMSGK